jgi:hypothetical protein
VAVKLRHADKFNALGPEKAPYTDVSLFLVSKIRFSYQNMIVDGPQTEGGTARAVAKLC